MNFGWTVGRERAFEILDAYRAAGGNFFQAVAAPELGFLPEAMKAPEEWLGEWIRAREIPRAELVLSTRMTLGERAERSAVGLAESIRRSCEFTLRRLGTKVVDVLVCEWQRGLLPIDDALRAFDILISAGYVRHVVAANFPLWRAMEAIGRSGARNRCRFEGLQTEFSVFSPDQQRTETLEFCDEYSLGFLATSTLGGSVPAGNRERENPRDGSGRKSAAHTNALLKLSAIAAERGLSIREASLAWVLAHPQVSSAVVSVNSPRQLEQLLRGTNSRFSGSEGRPETIWNRDEKFEVNGSREDKDPTELSHCL